MAEVALSGTKGYCTYNESLYYLYLLPLLYFKVRLKKCMDMNGDRM